MTRRQFYGATLIVLLLGSTAARAVDWPSASGTTATGVVIENGSGGLAPASGGTVSPPASGTGSTTAVTVTSTSGQALAAAVTRRFLYIGNESTTATIACNLGGTAILNTAGNYTIPPNTGRTWDGTFIPSDAVNCISSAATSPATVEAN